MAEARDGYERIMSLCRDELASIGERDTERLCSVLLEREEAIGRYVSDASARQDDAFLDKLEQIRDMNAMLRHEARKLHQSLKEELLNLRRENRRMAGYRSGALVTPMARNVISRKG
jgi:hypothetical protein